MNFLPSPMSSLIDDVVTYDLGESTCPPIMLGDLLTPAVLERLSKTALGYRTTLGDPQLRERLAANLGIERNQLIIAAGGIAAMYLVSLATCNADDEVIVATPCFPPALAVPTALETNVRPLRLRFDDAYRMDVDALQTALTGRTALVSLASP